MGTKTKVGLVGVMSLCALSITPSLHAAEAFGHGDDDPFIIKAEVHEWEYRKDGSKNLSAFDGEISAGYDINKLKLKVEAERGEGETHELELQALYSRAISPYWNVNLGLRHDIEPGPERSWAVIGIEGLAPYFIDMEASLFLGEQGHSAARVSLSHDVLLSQQWILTPEVELNLFAQNDDERRTGSSLSDMEAGLRLRYEIRPELAPYVGLVWSRLYGKTADYARDAGDETSGRQWVAGINVWF